MTLKNYENVNHLVLNFYPDGYSIAVKLNEFPVFTSETILETARISYEENSLLDYIENEELPPLLVEMIDSSPKLSQYKIWHNGCLILEVRDKIGRLMEDGTNKRSQIFAAKASQFVQNNLSHSTKWMHDNQDDECMLLDNLEDTKHIHPANGKGFFILLKPTNLSMLYDVLNLTDSNYWSSIDRLQLESQIVLHNSPILSLEPDPSKLPNDTNDVRNPKRRKLPHAKLDHLPSKQPVGTTVSCSSLSKFNYMRLDKSDSASGDVDLIDGGVVFHRSNYGAPDGLPPQLALQQFIATRKAKRKTLPTGLTPKFHRFREHSKKMI